MSDPEDAVKYVRDPDAVIVEGHLISSSALEAALELGISEEDFEEAMGQAWTMWHEGND